MISPVRNPVKLPRRAEDTPLYFVRESAAYRADGTQVAANVPRFEPGKFGKAVMVEEGTVNLNSDPFFKTGVSGWGKGRWTTLEWLSSEYNPISKQNGVMRLYDNDGTNRFCLKVVSISNTSHTVSVLLKILKGNINRINVGGTINYTDSTYTDYTWDNSNTTRYDMSAIYGQGVYKLVATITPNSSKTISNYHLRISHNDAVETELFVYAVQLEAKPYATSFIDGTRAAETLTIPTAGVLNPQQGTVKGFVNLWRAPGTTAQYIFDGAGAVNQNLVVYVGTDGKLRLEYGDGASMITLVGSTVLQKDTWYSVAWRWSSSGVELLLNGNLEASNINLPSLSFGANACLGSKADGTAQLDGLLDNFSVSGRVVPNVEVLEEYRSSMPKYSDEWTTALVM